MKQLKFIHITKCAGTSIEDIGIENNILWGRFHQEYGNWHEIFQNKSEKLKCKYDWFVIVRNPYERLISEFYCKWGGVGNLNDISYFDEAKFNKYVKTCILNRKESDRSPGTKMKVGHYVEQYKYKDPNANIHIIHFENIESEFNELMKKYKLNIKLNKTNNKCKHNKKFTVKSFNTELIKLINKIYYKDFITFNYTMKPRLQGRPFLL